MLKKLPQQERSRAMVEDILAAATRVLNERPLAAVSTNLVAEVAGVSIGSLYQYFDSKQAIVNSLLERHVHDCVTLANAVVTEGGGNRAIDCYRTVLRELLALHERERTLHLSFEQVGTARAGFANTAEHAAHARLFASRLAEEFPHLSDAESLLHAQVLMRIVNGLVHGAITLPVRGRDRLVVEHFKALASGYNRALEAGARI
jgi:AcrR family transcriptional regulator